EHAPPKTVAGKVVDAEQEHARTEVARHARPRLLHTFYRWEFVAAFGASALLAQLARASRACEDLLGDLGRHAAAGQRRRHRIGGDLPCRTVRGHAGEWRHRRAVERGNERGAVGEAVAWIFFEKPHDDRLEIGRNVRPPFAHRYGYLRHVLDHHGRRADAGKWRIAGQHLIRDGAERVEIAAAVDAAVARALLGRHVRRSADRRTRGGEAGTALLLGRRVRDAEIGDHHSAGRAVEKHV